MDPVSLPDPAHTPTSVTDPPPCHGPYQQPPAEFIAPDRRTAMLHEALQGVSLGGWDRRILTHLAHWCDTPTFLAILGWIERARRAVDQQLGDLAGEYELTKGHFSDSAADAIVTQHHLEQERDQARDLARLLHDRLASLGELPVGCSPAWIYQRADNNDRQEHRAGA